MNYLSGDLSGYTTVGAPLAPRHVHTLVCYLRVWWRRCRR